MQDNCLPLKVLRRSPISESIFNCFCLSFSFRFSPPSLFSPISACFSSERAGLNSSASGSLSSRSIKYNKAPSSSPRSPSIFLRCCTTRKKNDGRQSGEHFPHKQEPTLRCQFTVRGKFRLFFWYFLENSTCTCAGRNESLLDVA